MNVLNKKINVLLIDDDSDFLDGLKEGLSIQSDFDFDISFSADDASKKMKLKNYDAIICDIQMPSINGLTLLKSLRENGNKIPFIVFTVTDDKQTAMKAYQLGANGFVGKVGDPETIFSTLIKYIKDATRIL